MASGRATGAKSRLYLLTAVLVLWLGAIAGRLVFLQVVKYGDFTQRAQRQQQRSIEVAPSRGVLYDRNGNELAMSVSVDSIFAVPSEIPDPGMTAGLLSPILGMERGEIVTKLRSSRSFAWVARKVDADQSERVRALNLRGIYFQKESKRFYPKRELAAQTLGYVGLDDEGLGGIEREFDQQLRGRPGKMLISMDAKRRWFGRVERKPEPGQNLVLTIDEKIQYIAERELERAMADTRAKAGTIIVQDPRTGEILALANRPTFNPNMFRRVSPEALKNRAVSDVYEPGSTFKVVTIAGALEEKLTKPEEVIDCQNGAIVINGLRIRDHEPFGLLNVTGIMAHSSGVGTIKLGLRLGEQRFDQYIRRFGFGSQTGIELPGETRGLTKPVNRWSKVSIGAISMGQEIGISAVQLAGMMSTIAHDGQYVPPRIVAGVAPANADVRNVAYRPPTSQRILTPLTAVQLKKMLESVVLFGTGRKAILDGYSSAGKTGTAQKTDPATGAYSHSDYVASFAGFAPVNKPEVTVVVIIDSAKGLHQGGQIAAPVFQRVTQQVLAYRNVPHDVDIKNPQRLLLRAKVKDEDLDEESPDRLGGGLEMAGAAPEPPMAQPVSASGAARFTLAAAKQPAASPEKHSPLEAPASAQPPAPPGGTIVVDVEGGVVVPSLIGMPVRSALELAQDVGIELDVIGSGVAREQAPPPGSRIPAGARVAVRFMR